MKKLIALLPLSLALVGCSSPNIALKQNFWQDHKQRIAVTTNTVPRAALYQKGQEGLLDFAVNEGVTRSFRRYLSSYRLTPLSNQLSTNFVSGLKKRHIYAFRVARINMNKLNRSGLDDKYYATKDYRPLAIKIGAHKLLLISINSVGASRKYYGMIPLGAPKAFCILEGHLINLVNNKILWRYIANVYVPVQGKWDQPPNYPNFNRSLNQAVTLAKQQVTDNFFNTNQG